MFAISPQLAKVLLGLLFLLPWFSLQQKNFFPFLVYSGFDGELIILCELLFTIFIAFFGKHPALNKQGASLLFLLSCWHMSGIISATLSDHFHASLIKQIQYITHCLFAYSVWVFLRQHGKHQFLATALVTSFLWVVTSLILKWEHIEDPYSFNWVNGTPLFNNIRHMGFIQMALLPLLYLPFFSTLKYKKAITLILLIIFWSSVIWSGSRGTFFSAIIISLLVSFYFKSKRNELLPLTLIAFIFGWIIALQFPVDLSSLNPYRLLFLNFESGITSSEQLSSGRTEIWLRTLSEMWRHNPLFGFGANGYTYVSPRIWPDSVHPHSSPVQLLSEYGIIGFLSLIFSAVAIIQNWIKFKSNNLQLLSRFGIIGICIGSLVDGHFYHNFSLLFISILLALSFSFKPPENPSRKTSMAIGFCILFICIGLSLPIQRHWQSFMLQQTSLSDQEQLDTVINFPSFYSPSTWLTDFNADPRLLQQVLVFGQEIGPYHCKYFKQELALYSSQNKSDSFLKSMRKACNRSENNNEE